jgi:class I fructose-bisphosphate aldolase
MSNNIVELLGDQAKDLLEFSNPAVPKEQLYLPGPDFIDRVWVDSHRRGLL